MLADLPLRAPHQANLSNSIYVSGRIHTVQLSDLQPNTTYYYMCAHACMQPLRMHATAVRSPAPHAWRGAGWGTRRQPGATSTPS